MESCLSHITDNSFINDVKKIVEQGRRDVYKGGCLQYCKMLTARVIKEEGFKMGEETFAAYNMFQYIVLYLYIHYHYGKFEDLGMNNGDISTYIMMVVPNAKQFAQGMKECMEIDNVFYYDTKNDIAPVLIDMCKEIIYIEDNF